ncbi:carboxylesterase [Artomyces pyxidatus]|uniref:Carboxylesterase n=1 Tax=Artomyces pyxidatus TaxID=48021 RepID=A0ACB8TJI1_9AGAM|nr:carboxylesterase [Artomyces pyxidatus]
MEHLGQELARSSARVKVDTRFGPVIGGRAINGAAVFLEVPYGLPPGRFENPVPLPPSFRYEQKEYIHENLYAAQPTVDGQAAGVPWESKVGLGQPTENPFFVNIVAPPSFPTRSNFPVRVYIHGGFLQFGSPHGLSGTAQFVSAERSEVWVNIGYRLSAFGFLACDQPQIEGNFGFKDQWLALEWVKEHIQAFGGNPEDIQLTGLSAGAHSVHQLLHYASRLPPGAVAPFRSAILQSNGIAANPKPPGQLRPQYQALCRALKLDPDAPDTLSILRDPIRTPWQSITELIDSESLGAYGTFRGCLDGNWLPDTPDPMTWQRTGGLARGFLEHGVRSVVIGDLSEEWFSYAMAHPITEQKDILQNLERYYPDGIAERMIECYGNMPDGSKTAELQDWFGLVLSAGQVHLPVRLLHRDLWRAGFPVLRYAIEWTPEQWRPEGYVTHGTDRPLWAFLTPVLRPAQIDVARAWLTAVDRELAKIEGVEKSEHGVTEVLTLQEDKTILWKEDGRWEDVMALRKALPGEGD